MFGDSMFDEEERLRRTEEGRDEEWSEEEQAAAELYPVTNLDETLRRRQAVAQLLREVGGC